MHGSIGYQGCAALAFSLALTVVIAVLAIAIVTYQTLRASGIISRSLKQQ